MVIQNIVIIPILWRNTVSAISHRLKGTDISTWNSNFWDLELQLLEPGQLVPNVSDISVPRLGTA